MQQLNLTEIEDSKIFYENRYLEGYMDYWSEEDKRRVFSILASLNLGPSGEALDFGCGNGIFTEIMKKALPGWTIYGTDLSEVAIKNAKDNFKDCIFFVNTDKQYNEKKFDLIFTHHVLEHVYDINKIIFDICSMTKEKATMLHILPCGNINSHEYNICLLREDGINSKEDNRFFFEDEGHVRRLTTEQCLKYFEQHNFKLMQEYYCNHYYGAINWISNTNPLFIINMFNPIKGKNFIAKIKLFLMLLCYLVLFLFRAPTKLYNKIYRKKKRKKTLLDSIITFSIYIPYLISKFFDNAFIKLADKEYIALKNKQNGSEMFLYIARD